MDACLEWPRRCHQGLNAQCTCSIGSISELPCTVDREAPLGEHPLGSVEQAQPLLRLEVYRFPTKTFECRSGGLGAVIGEDVSLSDHGKCEVGERSKVA